MNRLDWEVVQLEVRCAGLGIEFVREAAKKHPVRMKEHPHLHRLDGSVTNW